MIKQKLILISGLLLVFGFAQTYALKVNLTNTSDKIVSFPNITSEKESDVKTHDENKITALKHNTTGEITTSSGKILLRFWLTIGYDAGTEIDKSPGLYSILDVSKYLSLESIDVTLCAFDEGIRPKFHISLACDTTGQCYIPASRVAKTDADIFNALTSLQ